jgi:hypothetical protein
VPELEDDPVAREDGGKCSFTVAFPFFWSICAADST